MQNVRIDFDCVIPVSGRDCIILNKSIPIIRQFLNPQKIFIITNKVFFVYFKKHKDIVLLDENNFVSNFDFAIVKSYLKQRGFSPKVTGWYFQQFIKLAFALSEYAKDYYLSWDADTIPIKAIPIFDQNSNKPFFTMKEEFHSPYFETINNLLGLNKLENRSFISENMLFDRILVKELIESIEKCEIIGRNWMQKVINAMPLKNNAFSEFETYGTFICSIYPDKYKLRELLTWRDAGQVISRFQSIESILGKAYNYDMISLEFRDNPQGIYKYFSLLIKVVIRQLNIILKSLN